MAIYTAAEQFIEAVASPAPTPGGGAVAAHTGALGCALALMAVSTTLKSKQLPAQNQLPLETGRARLNTLKNTFKQLTQQDAKAYEAFLTAKHLPKEDPARPAALQKALCNAAQIPTDTAANACHALEELKNVQPYIAPIIKSDAQCAFYLLQTCIRLAVENIRANLAYLQNPDQKELFQQKIDEFLKNC